DPKPQDVSNQKAASELASRLASFQIAQKPPTHTRRQCKFILTHIQRFSPAPDGRSEHERHVRNSTFNCVFAHIVSCSRTGIFHCKSLEIKKMCPNGNTSPTGERKDHLTCTRSGCIIRSRGLTKLPITRSAPLRNALTLRACRVAQGFAESGAIAIGRGEVKAFRKALAGLGVTATAISTTVYAH